MSNGTPQVFWVKIESGMKIRVAPLTEPTWKTAAGPNGAVYYIMDLANGRLVVTNTGGITFWPRPI
jgi:hypothetical protein